MSSIYNTVEKNKELIPIEGDLLALVQSKGFTIDIGLVKFWLRTSYNLFPSVVCVDGACTMYEPLVMHGRKTGYSTREVFSSKYECELKAIGLALLMIKDN